MKKQSQEKGGPFNRQSRRLRTILLVLISAFLMFAVLYTYTGDQNKQPRMEDEVPSSFIPIYKAAEKEFGVPWYLLAAHHRVETIFSTMDPMISPVGAEGHMQFMPCTFVGWAHPSCSGLGKGNIPEKEKTDPAVIKRYGGYGIDANGDGIADPFDVEDAIFSAANYLAKNGATEGELRKAVYSYNHSEEYVDEVLYFAERFQDLENKTGAASSRF